MITVAALYVDPRGPYQKMPGVDAWDETRDARYYVGTAPVVAHPPCGPWGRLRHLSSRPQDAEIFAYALEAVRRCGGVIEHPAGSKAWAAHGLPFPRYAGNPDIWRDQIRIPDFCDPHGYSIEVCQCEWGHVARKRTWLYLVGVPREALESPPFPGRAPTHWVSGSRKAVRGPVPPGIKVCSAEQRRRTPQLFAEYLVRLARATVRK